MKLTPAMAADEITRTAQQFAEGHVDVRDMWLAFHSNLNLLCRDEPLSGDLLALFEMLEGWETSADVARPTAVEAARAVARRIAAST